MGADLNWPTHFPRMFFLWTSFVSVYPFAHVSPSTRVLNFQNLNSQKLNETNISRSLKCHNYSTSNRYDLPICVNGLLHGRPDILIAQLPDMRRYIVTKSMTTVWQICTTCNYYFQKQFFQLVVGDDQILFRVTKYPLEGIWRKSGVSKFALGKLYKEYQTVQIIFEIIISKYRFSNY